VNRWVRAAVVALVAGLALVGGAGMAAAHPLGNFSVNRHSGIVVSPGQVRVAHVLDLAEIPTVQARAQVDGDGDGRFDPNELASWAAARCAVAARDMAVTVDGRGVALAARQSTARDTAGQAGLPTLRVECELVARFDRAGDEVALHFADLAADDQVGWREVTAQGDGTTLLDSDVPATSRSARLTSYPQDLLSSPLDVRGAQLLVRPGGPRLAEGTVASTDATPRLADRLTERVGSLVGGELTLLTIVAALLIAVVVGAVHAVAPGHGKTMVAFYLASRQEGRVRSALIVGATVTATHTVGVLALGLLVTAGTAFAPERAYPWLTLVSGLLVVAVGVTLARQAFPRRAASRELVAAHGHSHTHGHDHAHPHGHDHAHPHAPGRAGLVAMGLAGGLLPSPSALVVLLATVAVGKPWLGVVLVLAFGAGMAGTLTAAALLVSRVRDSVTTSGVLGGRLGGLARALPLVLAGTVVVLGLVLLLRGLAAVTA